MKKYWVKQAILITTFIVGFIMLMIVVFNGPMMQHATKQRIRDDVTPTKVAADSKKINQANFNYDSVTALSPLVAPAEAARSVVTNGDHNASDFLAVGTIKIPAVKLNLPIGLGVGKVVLSVGAGTMKIEQQMGQGNYALAGHHMINPNVLFSPLMRVKKGNIIYLSDTTRTYRYRVTSIKHVEKEQSSVVDDVEGKKLVTLVTCDRSYGTDSRLIVQGELIE
ncbi:class A sortase [Paucilactobacillus wasatchensis]|uniref:Sortase A n=1 Tax=Paucilactobacillus wasatchensis TaxID=1335616 RepID=A0A0D0Y3T7_9LACO|nr:class A sortase [Paucilactobacillus wasatchensis]KIS02918.1 Sortase A [Paucilactobacillus wasatchensis]